VDSLDGLRTLTDELVSFETAAAVAQLADRAAWVALGVRWDRLCATLPDPGPATALAQTLAIVASCRPLLDRLERAHDEDAVATLAVRLQAVRGVLAELLTEL
jgi:hypothetical protein